MGNFIFNFKHIQKQQQQQHETNNFRILPIAIFKVKAMKSKSGNILSLEMGI